MQNSAVVFSFFGILKGLTFQNEAEVSVLTVINRRDENNRVKMQKMENLSHLPPYGNVVIIIEKHGYVLIPLDLPICSGVSR